MADWIDERLDIVFFWKQNDTGLYGRRQDMLVEHLARDARVARIFHFDAPVDLRQWLLHPLRAGARHSEVLPAMRQSLRRGLHLADAGKVRHRTFFRLASRRRGFRPLLERIGCGRSFAAHVRRVAERHGIGRRRTVLWVCPVVPDFEALADAVGADCVVADIIDDQRRWAASDAAIARLEANYRAVLARADVALANCASVARAMAALPTCGVPVDVVPNAAPAVPPDAAGWPMPRRLRRLPGPRIGYVGNLDAERLDMPLIAQLAAARPAWSFVFIGSTHGNAEIVRLARRARAGAGAGAETGAGNIHLLGVERHDRAMRYIRHFDAALIPHLDNAITQHMNPLKLFVYAALGVPVVATPVDNIDAPPGCLRIARDAEEFARAIEAGMRQGSTLGAPQAARWLRENSWDARAARILERIEQSLGQKNPGCRARRPTGRCPDSA